MNDSRATVYGFLSRVFAAIPDKPFIEGLKQTPILLELLGESTQQWINTTPLDLLLDELNTDYSSLFIINSHPVESAVVDAKNDILIGLENPIVHFYFTHGYELNLNFTEILSPDHIAIETGFMENLILSQDSVSQKEFMSQFLITWAPLYLLGLKPHAKTPFYQDFLDFATEFIISDYGYIINT